MRIVSKTCLDDNETATTNIAELFVFRNSSFLTAVRFRLNCWHFYVSLKLTKATDKTFVLFPVDIGMYGWF